VEDVPLWQRAISLVGIGVLALLAWTMSSRRRVIHWRVVLWGIGLQLVFGAFVLKTSAGLALFSWLNDAVVKLLDFTREGSRFLFGEYLDDHFTVALGVLPTIVFFSSLMTVLYHLGVMQRVVYGIAWVMQRTMRTSGAETLSAAANIFVGQTEAPLVIRPFVPRMTRSELMAVMVGGFATVAGGVMAAYVGMLREHFPDIAGHLIAASVMSAPAALVIAKLLEPETEAPETAGLVKVPKEKVAVNVLDAATRGASDGLMLALNVAAMLLAFLALVALVNWLVALPFDLYNDSVGHVAVEPWTLQKVFGWLFWPIAFVMGVPPEDCTSVATLLGEKTVLNEFVAYLHLASGTADGTLAMSSRSAVIAIQIGGIGALAPDRRADLARLGFRAMLGGTLAACMTGAVAGVLV
jgi:CNT family concentrative nucleoside transporter